MASPVGTRLCLDLCLDVTLLVHACTYSFSILSSSLHLGKDEYKWSAIVVQLLLIRCALATSI